MMTLTLKPEDEKLIVAFAFRYAFGGGTCGCVAVGDFILNNWDFFSDATKEALRQSADLSKIPETNPNDVTTSQDNAYWLHIRNFMMEN